MKIVNRSQGKGVGPVFQCVQGGKLVGADMVIKGRQGEGMGKTVGGRTRMSPLSSSLEWRSGHQDRVSALLALPGRWTSM